MRILRPTGALVAAAALSLSAAPAAFATNGDNGNVKIHDIATGEFDPRNNPKVCTFYVDGFKFDGAQKVDWEIQAWANNDLVKGEVVKSGSLTLDGSGHERTGEMTLADGQYKLFWTFEGQKSNAAKHKVFKVDCADEDKPGEDKPGEDKPGEDKPGEDKPGEDKPGEDKPGEDKPGSEPSSTPDTSAPAAPSADGTSGDLAETGNGAPLGVLAGVAAALVAGGGYLLARRRTARQH
ncbi:LPXTG-motif cell wall-anchored protein [Streptomyces sp. V4I23]|uniref:LPXTG cell wall anchor domain-containing protein n=1 Tax=Streptomyces sp. V4I23 TaxID=3042282 RepID=UPI002780BE9A|nr:LPXTG cell wall anchor domain-containing protein [Streptomyces sp. V4I23]MDQ1010286.1 LPXTG-motif cell wall-anchored protein [Streptomyces sp. V4I23]